MNIEEIKTILPHRDNMLLIDEAEVRDGIAYAKKKITCDEWFLKGHFPGNPVVPGVILCEILAQSTCVLLISELSTEKKVTPFFTGLDKVRFTKVVTVGDTIQTECKITRSKPPFYFAEGKGYINNQMCVKAEFSFALIPDKD